MNWLMLLLAIVFTAGANLMLKLHGSPTQGAEAASSRTGGLAPFLVSQRHRVGGLVLLAAAFAVYARAVESIDVSLAYPVMTGSVVVLVTVLAAALFDEGLGPPRIVGLALLVVGIGVVARS